ncbi:MAG: xylose isomerase [Segetibacter sp.]|nr:xylose isomerase [Segetibacter sp.]
MHPDITRRKFLFQFGFTIAAIPFFSCKTTKNSGSGAVPGLQLGYSAITWGGNDVQAIKDIAALGFKGVQLRSNILKEYGSKPQEIKALLRQYHLDVPMFSSGNANINTGNDEAVIKTHVDNATFVKAIGGKNMQVTNSSRPKQGNPTTEDLQKYGRLINEVGKRTRDMGVQTHYHNHMGQLGQTTEEVQIILENCDSNNVRLLLDVAHYHQGGGDAVKAIDQYKSRIDALHLKDVRPKPGADPEAYTFVELGQGKVDLPGIFKALSNINFKGWGIVELDSVPAKEKSPVQCANISKSYLTSQGIEFN